MNDVSARFLWLTLHGASWVLWLLIGLSVISLGVMLERLWFFRIHRVARGALAAEMRRLLEQAAPGSGGHLGARPGTNDLAAAIEGAKVGERMRLERHLAFLATLGSNGPFIGLFGTVLGIIKAFHDLAANQASGGASTIMAGISEALVATAVGLMVAIPAVIAFNYFNRRIRVRMAEVDWMAHLAAADVQAGLDGAALVSGRAA
jgi:biopolymer transport protein ExbB